ncbi:MAG: 30S ribosomal protein S16 [Patescibacteria group bacterium]
MLKIRLQRVGRTNVPTFRVVLTDSKNSTKSGRFLEILGSYDTRKDSEKKVNAERVKYWISKGAQVSGTLHNFLIHTKVITGKKINVLPKKTPIKKEEVAKVEKPAEAAAPTEVAPSVEAASEAVKS